MSRETFQFSEHDMVEDGSSGANLTEEERLAFNVSNGPYSDAYRTVTIRNGTGHLQLSYRSPNLGEVLSRNGLMDAHNIFRGRRDLVENNNSFERWQEVPPEDLWGGSNNIHHFYHTFLGNVNPAKHYKGALCDLSDAARLFMYIYRFHGELSRGHQTDFNRPAQLSKAWWGLMRYRTFLMKALFETKQYDCSKARKEHDFRLIVVAMNVGVAGQPNKTLWEKVVVEVIRLFCTKGKQAEVKYDQSIDVTNEKSIEHANTLLWFQDVLVARGYIDHTKANLHRKGMSTTARYGHRVAIPDQNILIKNSDNEFARSIDSKQLKGPSAIEWILEFQCNLTEKFAELTALSDEELGNLFPCREDMLWEEFLRSCKVHHGEKEQPEFTEEEIVNSVDKDIKPLPISNSKCTAESDLSPSDSHEELDSGSKDNVDEVEEELDSGPKDNVDEVEAEVLKQPDTYFGLGNLPEKLIGGTIRNFVKAMQNKKGVASSLTVLLKRLSVNCLNDILAKLKEISDPGTKQNALKKYASYLGEVSGKCSDDERQVVDSVLGQIEQLQRKSPAAVTGLFAGGGASDSTIANEVARLDFT